MSDPVIHPRAHDAMAVPRFPDGYRPPPDVDERGALAQAAVDASIIGGTARTLFDAGRVVPKLPEARRNGMLRIAVRQMLTAAPTTTILDPDATGMPDARGVTRTFNRIDRHAYRTSTLAGAGMASVQFLSAAPNLYEALREEGPIGLVNSTSGRTGVLQALGGGLALGMLGKAGIGVRAAGVTGAVPTLLAASGAASLTRPWVAGVGLVSAALVLANEWGFFDFLNKGEKRDVPTIMSDAVSNLPLL